jgi:hypothetical protein
VSTTEDPDPVLHEVVARELELLEPAVRSSRARLEDLLHPDFVEIGERGDRWERETLVALLSGLGPSAQPPVEVSDVHGSVIAEGVALVLYDARHEGQRTRRSTVWRRDEDGAWRAVFHQGTPYPEPARPVF